MVEFLNDDEDSNGKDSFLSQYENAKTNNQRDQVANRAKAEMDGDYYIDEKVVKSQKERQPSIDKAMKLLSQDDGDALQEQAARVLMDAGIKNPRDGEVERLAMSWTGAL